MRPLLSARRPAVIGTTALSDVDAEVSNVEVILVRGRSA